MALKYKNTNLEVNGNLKVTSNLTDGTNSVTVADLKSAVDLKVPTLPTTDGKYKLVCNVVNGVPTMTWAYTEDASAQGYSGNITTYQGDGPSGKTTYIKFDTAPTDANDYDSYVDGSGKLTGLTSYSNKTKVYVWGTYHGTPGTIIINNVSTSGGLDYVNAVEVTLTGNYDIELEYHDRAVGN